MNSYNLTDKQKDLLHRTVQAVRADKLEYPLLPVPGIYGNPVFLSDDFELGFELMEDLDALCDAGLMARGRNSTYTIRQAGYDAVDRQFEIPTESKASDTFNMSGNFQGAIINIKSSLSQTSQTISALPTAEEATKAELQRLIEQLTEALQQVPPDKAEEAEAVAKTAENLVKTAAEEKPNKTMIQISGEGLKQAAKNLAAVTPAVLAIATQIVTTISQLVK